MRSSFVRSARLVAFRGVVGLLFGIAMFLWPSLTLVALVVLFGVYALVDGAFAVLAGAGPRSPELGWVLDGLLGMAFGLLVFLWGAITLPVLTNLLAFWAILTGLLELFAAVRIRKQVPGELSLAFAGAGSFLLGIVLLFWPAGSAVALAAVLGSYALLFGASMLVLALRLHKLTTRLESTHAHRWPIDRRGHA